MSATGLATFDSTLEKTNGILKQIEQAYGWPKERRNQSYQPCEPSCTRCATS